MAHRKSHRRSRRSLNGLSGMLPATVFGLSLPVAALVGFVGYKVYKNRQARQPSAAQQVAVATQRVTTVTAPATTPGASVPKTLTPGGRSEDIKARIKGGFPINTVVGRA